MTRRWYGGYPNRTICDILSEMRTAYEARNFSYILGLIEEVQSLANRMEAAISDMKDLNEGREYKSKLKKEIKELETKAKGLRELTNTNKGNIDD